MNMPTLPEPGTGLLAHLQLMARYHAWATTQLWDEHLMLVQETHYRQPSGLFFGSVHHTLNHLLVGEAYLWYRRFAHGESVKIALNAVVEEDRQALRAAMLAQCERWIGFTSELAPELLGGQLHYTTTAGVALSLPYASTLAHVFNHATHHRGQISAGLTALGYPAPVMDLVYYLVEQSNQHG